MSFCFTGHNVLHGTVISKPLVNKQDEIRFNVFKCRTFFLFVRVCPSTANRDINVMTVVTTKLGGHATLCATPLSNLLFDCTRLSRLIPNQLVYIKTSSVLFSPYAIQAMRMCLCMPTYVCLYVSHSVSFETSEIASGWTLANCE